MNPVDSSLRIYLSLYLKQMILWSILIYTDYLHIIGYLRNVLWHHDNIFPGLPFFSC